MQLYELCWLQCRTAWNPNKVLWRSKPRLPDHRRFAMHPGRNLLILFAVISGNHSYMPMFVRECVGYTDEEMFKCETVEVSFFIFRNLKRMKNYPVLSEYSQLYLPWGWLQWELGESWGTGWHYYQYRGTYDQGDTETWLADTDWSACSVTGVTPPMRIVLKRLGGKRLIVPNLMGAILQKQQPAKAQEWSETALQKERLGATKLMAKTER